MLIVDLETSGTDPRYHSILSIGALDFDHPEDEFFQECRAFEGAHVEEESLAVNGYKKEELFDPNKQSEAKLVESFLSWMREKRDHTFAGQNVHFDTSFVIAACERAHLDFSISKRIVDLHSIATFHMIKRNIAPPVAHKRSDLDSDKIMNYVGIPAEVRPHIAINGARIEAEAFSRLFYDKSLYPDYKNFKIPWQT